MKCFALPLLLACALPLAAPALEWHATNDFALKPGQTLTNELWLSAETAKISGVAERGVFVQAQTLELAGAYRRDVWALADTLEYSGRAEQAVRVAAKRSVQLSGDIGGTLLAFGDTVQLQKSLRVADDVVLLGQDIIVEGTLSNQLWALGNKVTLAGEIGGSVRIVAEEITLLPGTKIAGDLRYSSTKDLVKPEGVTIGGQLLRVAKPNFGLGLPALSLAQLVTLQFAMFLAALLVGLPFVSVFPLFTSRAVTALRTQSNKCLLAGGIALAALPMVAVMAALTWIGLPLGLLLLGIYGALLYLAKIIVAIPLAAWLLTLRGPAGRPLGALPVLVVGLFLLYIGAALPFVGFAVWLATVLYGMGALVLALLGGQKGLPLVMLAPDRPPPPAPPPLAGFGP
jgi:cytoskeletal protein CcmA (bactofilin family)